jgi:hypothetical protein
MPFLPSSQRECYGFSLGPNNKASHSETNKNDDFNKKDTSESTSNRDEQKEDEQRLEPKSKGVGSGLTNKSKNKRNRRKERKRNHIKTKSLKLVGVNAAGLLGKLESFEKLLVDEEPSIFSLQETKLSKPNQIKTEATRNYTMYELLREKSGGGGLCLGVHKDLQPVWIAQGDDEVEFLAIEVWVNEFTIRVVNGYGPQLGDSIERKRKFWDFIEREVNNAIVAGAGFILQMDGNCHLGDQIIKNDPNVQNTNGKLFCEFLTTM